MFVGLQENIPTLDCCKLETNKTRINMDCLQLTIFKVMLHRSNQLCPRRQQTAVQQWKCTRGALPPPPAVTACTTRPSFVARPPWRAVGVLLSPVYVCVVPWIPHSASEMVVSLCDPRRYLLVSVR